MSTITTSPERPLALLRTQAAAPPSADVAGRSLSLPPDLQDKACRRLAQFALMMTVLLVAVALASPGVWEDLEVEQKLIICSTQGIVILLSFGLWLLARWRRLGVKLKLRLGLAYVILFCLVYSVGYNWFTAATYNVFAAMTIATLLIAIYPLIVPSPPRQMLLVSIAAAATAPLSMFVVASMGLADHLAHDYLAVSIYPAICVVFAQFGSRVVHGLRSDVLRARELGSYRLEERLGRGGMGEVWRAHHRLLPRPAAVKLIKREPAGDDSAGARLTERFKREAKATAMLESPHTVNVFDFGVTEASTFYLAMELVEGVDLESMVREHGPLAPERVVYLMQQVCHSLAEAHQRGLIHRDIKPANIMVCGDRAGDSDFVKVLDFGVVAIRSEQIGVDTKLTAENRIVGTPAYMSPELFETGAVTEAVDIYSLGCVMFWLLSGRRVFDEGSPIEVAVAHYKKTPPALSTLVDDLPVELEKIVAFCLAKSPSERPSSVRTLAALLRDTGLASKWSQRDARAWWSSVANERSSPEGQSESSPQQSGDSFDQTLSDG